MSRREWLWVCNFQWPVLPDPARPSDFFQCGVSTEAETPKPALGAMPSYFHSSPVMLVSERTFAAFEPWSAAGSGIRPFEER